MSTINMPEHTEQFFEKLLMETPCPTCVARTDDMHSVLFANRAFFDMFEDGSKQKLRSEALSDTFLRIAPNNAEHIARQVKRVSDAEVVFASAEMQRLDRNGVSCWTTIHIRRVVIAEPILIFTFEDTTAYREAEERARILEDQFQLAVHYNDKTVFRYDISKKTAYLSAEAAELYGRDTIENLPERVTRNGLLKNDSRTEFQQLIQTISDGTQSSGSAVLQMCLQKRKEGYDWYRVCYSIIYNREGAPSQAIVSLQNISEQHERELAYKKWEQTYAAIPQSKVMYLEFDLTRNLFEYSKGGLADPMPDIDEPTMEAVLDYYINKWVYVADRPKLANHTSRAKLLTAYFKNSQISDMEYRHRRKNNSYGWVRVSVQMLPDPYSSNIRAYLLFQDIDSSKKEELKLQDRLCSDPLTGVLNRKAFVERAEQICSDKREGSICAFVMVDVDNFKQVNDRFGHAYGDRVLVQIADTLRSSIRESDLVARMGGDEFLLLLRNVTEKKALHAKLTQLREQIYQRVSSEIVISCSFGAACYPMDGKTFESLYFKSDLALYIAKEEGRNCACVYERGMRPQRYLRDAGEM